MIQVFPFKGGLSHAGTKKAPEDLTAKKALALEVIRRLKAEYPDAGCTLDYDHAWQLLVSVRLAAQCTDARVNIVWRSCLQNTQA